MIALFRRTISAGQRCPLKKRDPAHGDHAHRRLGAAVGAERNPRRRFALVWVGAPVASNFVLGHARRFGPHRPVEPDADASDPGGDGLVAIDGDKLVTAAAMTGRAGAAAMV